jgi:phage FluMu protein Com
MDELARYAVAQMRREYAEAILHDVSIPPGRRPYYWPCDCHVDPRPVQCDRLFVVAHNEDERVYLTGQCPRCDRLHMFVWNEIAAD